mgnify:CR=1 FL=1
MTEEVRGRLSFSHHLVLEGYDGRVYYRSNVCTVCGGYCDGQEVICSTPSKDWQGWHVYSLRHADAAYCLNPNIPGASHDSVEGALGGEGL